MKREKYLTPTPYGTRASIRIDGHLYQKHYPSGTDLVDMRQWIVQTEIAHRKGPSSIAGAFDVDAARYLLAVAAMTSYSDRRRDIEAWIGIFEHRSRGTITSAEIATALQAWRQTLSASSCNSRRAALQHLFTMLDGKDARNPVRAVPKFQLPAPAPRALDYKTIRKILTQIPKGPDKARLSMIAYVGLPHGIIAQLTPDCFNAKEKTLMVPGRKKGRGVRGRALPLTQSGVRAVALMASTKAWGAFPRFHLRRVFSQACAAVGVTVARPYDLRHSFGTELYRTSGDQQAVQFLMLHASPQMTQRYTLAAIPSRAKRAIKGFGR
jgi:integrase